MTPESPVLHEVAGLTEHVAHSEYPEFPDLPALVNRDGKVTTRWRATFLERLQVLIFGDIWIQSYAANNKFQPILVMVDQPDAVDCVGIRKEE